MSEAYLHFFILLSIFLLLKSFIKESNHRRVYFILGAISFGFALNIKLVAIELVIPILVLILFYHSFNEKLNFRFFKNRKNILKVISLVLVFFVIVSVTFVATFPRYHDNTFNQILKITEAAEIGQYASFPTLEKNYLYQTLTTLQVSLLPYLMDSYIHDVFPDESRNTRLAEKSPPNYSTIPVLLFFFIGFITMIRKIKTGNLRFSEFALLVWFTSLFIYTLLVVDFPTVERFYLPLMFPVILIASYGLGNFIKQIQNEKEKILFFISFIIAHSIYIISLFDKIYFSSNLERTAEYVSSQVSLNYPLVYVATITFIMIFVLILIRIKTRISIEARQARTQQKL